MKKIKTTVKDAGERFDKFLSEKLKPLSRSHIQKLIKGGEVLVNGKISAAHYALKEADIITIKGTELAAPKKEKALNFVAPKIDIIADTEEYLVVNKPAGLVVHGAPHIKEYTLIDAILKKYPKIGQIGEDPDRPGIMHRLDKEVSGLMVIAKTQDSFDNLKKQFQKRTMEKSYVGLVRGELKKENDIIDFPIDRSSSGHKMAALPKTHRGFKNEEGKMSITEFSTIKKYINYTLLSIKIKTGRTHQIRVHMAAYGHPIVGDALYGTPTTKSQDRKIGIKRNFLFACKLGFTDLKGDKQFFEIEMPEELKTILYKIK